MKVFEPIEARLIIASEPHSLKTEYKVPIGKEKWSSKES